jgi:aspartyl-tRNA(Asn)/glutamyl-tRNA(Gln) amidotransferase subunit B
MQKAIDYEIERQIAAHEAGEPVVQETRLWDEKNNRTRVMRSKEDAHDYRYFPEPDLPPVILSNEFIERIEREMPELPDARRDRFIKDYDLSFADASQLVGEKDLADFYEKTTEASGNARLAANWIRGEVVRELETLGKPVSDSPVSTEKLAELIKAVDVGKINNNQGKEVLSEMFATGKNVAEIIAEKGLEQVSDAGAIEKIADEIIAANPAQVDQYRAGNQKLFGFFVGQTMRASGGKANPKVVNDVLNQKLK